MHELYIEAESTEEVVGILVEFLADIYEYLNLELPEDFDPDAEFVSVVQAIKDFDHGNKQ